MVARGDDAELRVRRDVEARGEDGDDLAGDFLADRLDGDDAPSAWASEETAACAAANRAMGTR